MTLGRGVVMFTQIFTKFIRSRRTTDVISRNITFDYRKDPGNLPFGSNSAFYNLYKQNYKKNYFPEQIGGGGTPDIVVLEAITERKMSKIGHLIKFLEYYRNMQRIMDKRTSMLRDENEMTIINTFNAVYVFLITYYQNKDAEAALRYGQDQITLGQNTEHQKEKFRTLVEYAIDIKDGKATNDYLDSLENSYKDRSL